MIAEQRVAGRAAAARVDVAEAHPGPVGETQRVEMVERADLDTETLRVGCAPRRRDGVAQIAQGRVLSHHERVAFLAALPEHIEVGRREIRDAHRRRGDQRLVDEQDRVAIGSAVAHLACAYRRAAPDDVDHRHRLADRLLEGSRDEPRVDVGATAGGVRHHDPELALGKGVRMRRGEQARPQGGPREDLATFHGGPPSANTAHPRGRVIVF